MAYEVSDTMYRTCQECFKVNIHIGKHPSNMTEKEFKEYCNKSCKFCKSEALDYGSESDPRIAIKEERK